MRSSSLTLLVLLSLVACSSESEPEPVPNDLPEAPVDAVADVPDVSEADVSAPADLSGCPDGERFALVGVTVLAMDGQGDVLEQAAPETVVISGDTICAVVPAAAVLPEDVLQVDLTGRFVMPGLIDMHVHINRVEEGISFLANGVTSVRCMWGSAERLAIAEAWRIGSPGSGDPGPAVWSTGPIMDGDPPYWAGSDVVTTAAEAQASVSAQLNFDYDYVKAYSKLSVEAYQGLVDAAAAAGRPVVGHVPDAVGVQGVIEAGQRSIEHLDGYDLSTSDGSDEALTASSGVVNCPTLVVYDRYARVDEFKASPPDWLRFVHPSQRAWWDQAVAWQYAPMSVLQAKVAELRELGAPFVAGTDAGNPYVPAGFSLHDELALLVGAGMTPLEALRAATVDAAALLGSDVVGVIAPGKQADLLVLGADPRVDINNTREIVGVVEDGRWMQRATLTAALEQVAERYEAIYDLGFDCEQPPGYLEPPSSDALVLRAAGPITTFDDADAYAAREISLTLDGAEVVVDSFSAFFTASSSLAGDTITLHTFSAYEPIATGHSAYWYLSATVPQAGPVVSGTTNPALLSRMSIKTVGADTLVRMCPWAATDPNAGSDASWRVCADAEPPWKQGQAVQLAGRHLLTTDPAAVQAAAGLSAPCICWKNAQQPLDCTTFEAATP